MAEEQKKSKYASEVIDLPSKGKVYPKDSPLSSGKLEIKYMTAREDDILTSQNLIKKGVVIEKVIDSLILTKGVTQGDMILGDKNAVMVAARVLAYGPEYECEVTNPNTGNKFNHIFDLTKCPFIELPDGYEGNSFEMILPICKKKITFKLLTGNEESIIEKEVKSLNKVGDNISRELTTRLRHTITSVDGDTDQSTINKFVDSMLSRDSLFFRSELLRLSPDINLTQEVELEGESVKVDIPMTVTFFWPSTKK